MTSSNQNELPAVNAVDAIVSKLLHDMQCTQRGFVLDLAPSMSSDLRERLKTAHIELAEGGEHTDLLQALERVIDAAAGTSISVSPPVAPLPLIDDRKPKAARRVHQLHDTASFIRFCERYGSAEKSVVMVDQGRAVVVLDELIDDGEREYGVYQFHTTQQFTRWHDRMGRRQSHGDFYDFLLANQHDVLTESLLTHVANASVNVQTKGMSLLSRERTEVGVIFKAEVAGESTNIPGAFDIEIPVLLQDIGAEISRKFTVQLTPLPPRKPGDTPTLEFLMTCPDMEVAVYERSVTEANSIREALDQNGKWCVLSASPTYMPPSLGANARPVEICTADGDEDSIAFNGNDS